MDQELFNPQSSSVSSSRIIYTPSTFARTSLLHLQEVGSLQAVHPHVSKQLLRFTDMTVDEVGVAVGMGDANYFSRMFRKVEGSSPREYRKQW